MIFLRPFREPFGELAPWGQLVLATLSEFSPVHHPQLAWPSLFAPKSVSIYAFFLYFAPPDPPLVSSLQAWLGVLGLWLVSQSHPLDHTHPRLACRLCPPPNTGASPRWKSRLESIERPAIPTRWEAKGRRQAWAGEDNYLSRSEKILDYRWWSRCSDASQLMIASSADEVRLFHSYQTSLADSDITKVDI